MILAVEHKGKFLETAFKLNSGNPPQEYHLVGVSRRIDRSATEVIAARKYEVRKDSDAGMPPEFLP